MCVPNLIEFYFGRAFRRTSFPVSTLGQTKTSFLQELLCILHQPPLLQFWLVSPVPVDEKHPHDGATILHCGDGVLGWWEVLGLHQMYFIAKSSILGSSDQNIFFQAFGSIIHGPCGELQMLFPVLFCFFFKQGFSSGHSSTRPNSMESTAYSNLCSVQLLQVILGLLNGSWINAFFAWSELWRMTPPLTSLLWS